MKAASPKGLGVMVAIAVLCVAWSAEALTVQYSVGASGPMHFPAALVPPEDAPWGPNGYPGDTVWLDGYTDSFDLQYGSSVLKVNTLHWMIDYTYGGTATDPNDWHDLTFDFAAPRSMTLDAGTSVLGQAGQLRCTWDNDFLSFENGLATRFVVGRYQIDVTPLGLSQAGSDFGGSNPWIQPTADLTARFDVSEVPEPTSLVLGGLALLAFGAGRVRSKRRQNA
jgi:hypothetical protein